MEHAYLEKILRAKVYDVARETPLDRLIGLSTRLGNHIWLKREDLQSVFSFKLRGAYNKMASLDPVLRKKGVIAASAGNHAQGVALSAQKMGIPSTIVMPKTTPGIKIGAVKALGSEVILHGNTYDEAYEHSQKLAQEKELTFIHPYDDPEVIAGQGTVALEILRQIPTIPDAIFVPVGGGGLVAGVTAYVKSLYPHIKVYGVEPEDAACLHAALASGTRTILDQVGIFADGVAVRQIGAEPFRLVKELIDGVYTLTTDEICAAIKDIFDNTRSIAEPAGALAIAGLKKHVEYTGETDKNFVAICSGANMNFDRLRHVSERAEIGEHREGLLAVTIPEKPGSFRKFCHSLGQRSITEFNYRYASHTDAHVFVGIQLREGATEKDALISKLEAKEYKVIDLSDNEMAKIHIRYMVGGHSNNVTREVLYRFEFPERPGALLRFLTHLGESWNISLFHYRNHGAAYGRVLVGIQVPEQEEQKLNEFLQKLNYNYWCESDNPAYKLFLG
ncbi:MAG: threonine ammonia-lyase, biosynthetic [Gammaproteobacteria bacterium]|nr:threonine ammonia-lyase, biosynthetic [Gammaproteobacteria bacterium]